MTAISFANRRIAWPPWRPSVALLAGVLLAVGYDLLPVPGALAALVLFVLFAAVEPPTATAITLAAAPFYLPNPSNPLPPRAFGSLQFTLVESFVLALAAGYGLRAVARRLRGDSMEIEWLRSPADRPVVVLAAALILLGALSVALAKYQWVALRELRTVVVEPVLFFFVARSVARTAAGRRYLAGGLIGAAAVVSAYAIGHYWVSGVVEETGGVARALGVYHSPNALALFLDRIAPFVLAVVLGTLWPFETVRRHGGPLTVSAPRAAPNHEIPEEDLAEQLPLRPAQGEQIAAFAGARAGAQKDRSLHVVLPAGALVVTLAAIALTFSRAAWIAASLGLLYVVVRRNRRAGALMAAILAIATVAVVLLVPPERLLGGETIGRRLNVWHSAINLLLDHPLVGIGLDNFLYYYRDEGYLFPDAAVEPDISHPHNWLLDWWLRLGIGGVVEFIALQVAFWRRIATFTARPLGLGLGGLMLVTLIHGLVDNAFFVIDLAFVFWLAMALAYGGAKAGSTPECKSW